MHPNAQVLEFSWQTVCLMIFVLTLLTNRMMEYWDSRSRQNLQIIQWSPTPFTYYLKTRHGDVTQQTFTLIYSDRFILCLTVKLFHAFPWWLTHATTIAKWVTEARRLFDKQLRRAERVYKRNLSIDIGSTCTNNPKHSGIISKILVPNGNLRHPWKCMMITEIFLWRVTLSGGGL